MEDQAASKSPLTSGSSTRTSRINLRGRGPEVVGLARLIGELDKGKPQREAAQMILGHIDGFVRCLRSYAVCPVAYGVMRCDRGTFTQKSRRGTVLRVTIY